MPNRQRLIAYAHQKVIAGAGVDVIELAEKLFPNGTSPDLFATRPNSWLRMEWVFSVPAVPQLHVKTADASPDFIRDLNNAGTFAAPTASAVANGGTLDHPFPQRTPPTGSGALVSFNFQVSAACTVTLWVYELLGIA